MNSTSLDTNTMYGMIACILGFLLAWTVLFLVLRGKEEVLKSLFTEGIFLRMLTVSIIVVAAAFLALLDKLTAEVSAILAGIAGYVLGGLQKKSM